MVSWNGMSHIYIYIYIFTCGCVWKTGPTLQNLTETMITISQDQSRSLQHKRYVHTIWLEEAVHHVSNMSYGLFHTWSAPVNEDAGAMMPLNISTNINGGVRIHITTQPAACGWRPGRASILTVVPSWSKNEPKASTKPSGTGPNSWHFISASHNWKLLGIRTVEHNTSTT